MCSVQIKYLSPATQNVLTLVLWNFFWFMFIIPVPLTTLASLMLAVARFQNKLMALVVWGYVLGRGVAEQCLWLQALHRLLWRWKSPAYGKWWGCHPGALMPMHTTNLLDCSHQWLLNHGLATPVCAVGTALSCRVSDHDILQLLVLAMSLIVNNVFMSMH